ncbi:hypothetical protein M9434_000626 [Picochlorum sp. BPE23]|nr:hypothetical protein M9434_000626 [Picochlorum sp. BPE23]
MHSSCSLRPSSLGKVSCVKQNRYRCNLSIASIGRHRPCDLENRSLGSREAYGRRRTLFVLAQSTHEHVDASYEYSMWMDRIRSLRSPSVRSVALEQLLRVDEEGAYAGLVSGSPEVQGQQRVDVLDEETSPSQKVGLRSLDQRERRQVTEIVSGVIRWQRCLHWILKNLPKPTKLESMDSPLRILLYMGTYELLELNMASHAINDYVNIAKGVMHEGCGKVANGVLRSVVRAKEGSNVPCPPPPRKGMTKVQVAHALGIMYSHPTWMICGWLEQYGPQDTVALLKCNNKRPRFSLRIQHPELLSGVEATFRPSQFLPHEFIVVESGLQNIIRSGMLAEGNAQVQDEAAGMVVAMLHPEEGDAVLDCCSAPGGKTLFSAARMNSKGSIIALDSVESRLGAVRNAAAKQGYDSIVQCIASDARQFCENSALSGDHFDKVLVDAPCSGTGVLSKRADLRWRRKEEDVKTLVTLQLDLLHAASKVVRPGGYLVYSTCSIENVENIEVANAFLQKHEDFELVHGSTVPGIPLECLDEHGCLQMLPHRHGTDGAFAAKFRKKM